MVVSLDHSTVWCRISLFHQLDTRVSKDTLDVRGRRREIFEDDS